MDLKQKQGFVKAVRRQGFAKGGSVRKLPKRKYFDSGGLLAAPSTAGVNNTAANPNTGVLGTVGGALGLNNNFAAGSANIQQGTNADQLNQAYTGANDAIGNQVRLANTLSPQAQIGVNNQTALSNQLLAMSQGQGPNPAQAQLNQSTNQNVNNQAALMAGQRGASSNAGLLARQAAQQGAATQQEAAGQGATLEAQQQIAAQSALGNLANNQIGQAGQATTGLSTAQQNEQSILQNANTSANNNAVGMQSNVNNVNAQTAAANQQSNQGLFGGITSGLSSLLSKGGEVTAHKDDHVKLAEMNAAALNHGRQNFAQGGFAAPQPLVVQNGAPVQSFGGTYTGMQAPGAAQIQATPQIAPLKSSMPTAKEGLEKVGKKLFGKPENDGEGYDDPDRDTDAEYLDADAALGAPGIDNVETQMPANNFDQDLQNVFTGGRICDGPNGGHVANYLAFGGNSQKEVPVMVSAGEIALDPKEVKEVVKGKANPLKVGKKFEGKEIVKGDSKKNDVIKDDLEEGSVVIKKSVVNKMDPKKAKEFVKRSVAKKKGK